MKTYLPILVAAAGGAALGWGACRGMGFGDDWRGAAVAAGVVLIATVLALGAIRVAAGAGATQDVVAQAALVAGVVQLFATCGLAGVAWMMRLFPRAEPFLVWLVSLYWALLTGLAVASVRQLRAAPVAGAGSSAGSGGAEQNGAQAFRHAALKERDAFDNGPAPPTRRSARLSGCPGARPSRKLVREPVRGVVPCGRRDGQSNARQSNPKRRGALPQRT